MDTDADLVAACLRGEQAAWDALVDRYAALIYSIPLKYGLSEADAADIFQSVCVTLLEKLSSIREPRGLAAWIMTTTSRLCWLVARRRNRELARSTSEDASTEQPEVIDPKPLPEDQLLALERRQLVRNAVARLTPRCRQLVEALFSDFGRGSTYQSLAADLGMPVNSLGPTRARCLAHLRRLLDAAGYEQTP